MAPPADHEVQQAVDIAVLQTQVAGLTQAVQNLTTQVTALVQAQTGAKWLGGAVVYLVPIAALVVSALSYFRKLPT
jgi:hypothetical protein